VVARPTENQGQSLGIVAFGAYIPINRLSRDAVAAAWGSRSIGGERSVANYDEDTITMAVEAARDCVAGMNPGNIGALYFASTTAPYQEKGCATLVAKALDLPRDILTADFANSLRSGTSALLAAMAAVASGQVENALVVAADCRLGYPNSTDEQLFGDAAAAVMIGKTHLKATIDSFTSHADEIHDLWRRNTDTFVRSWEDRFTMDEGYALNMKESLSILMKKSKITPKDVSKIALYAPDARSGSKIVSSLGFDPKTQLQDSLVATVGVTGTAHALLLLNCALEQASSSDRIILGSYGDGAHSFLLTSTKKITEGLNGLGVAGHLSSKKTLPTYEKYALYRNIIAVKPEAPLRVFQYSGASITWRERNSIISMHGSRCKLCGTVQFPIQRICYTCRSRDDYTEVRLADRPGKVFTYSLDNLAGGPNAPVPKGVIESEEGNARLSMAITDCDQSEIHVGLPVELTFRRFHEGADMHNYYWKARPARNNKNTQLP
jgi:hydroxymethylglutaryl-CoA synthase